MKQLRINYFISTLILAVLSVSLISCTSADKKPALVTVPKVDLNKFMGRWYVLANIPTVVEKNCFNAIENYNLLPDGNIDIIFTCNKEKLDGKLKEYNFKGLIQNKETNAEWKVQLFWPLRLPYLVIDLAEDYSYTVIGYPSRNYLWIMAREKKLSDTQWKTIYQNLESQHYDTSKILRIEHTP